MHPSPDVLALLALGEQAGTAEERIHVDGCPVCLAEVAEFVRVAAVGRSATATDELQPPRPEVWQAVRSELGLGEGTTTPRPSDGKVAEVPPETVQELPRARSSRESTGTGSSAAVPHSGRRNSRGRRALSLALAAAVALVVGFGLGFLVDQVVQPTQTVVERAQLQALPAWPGATGEAWVERDSTGDRFLEVRVDSVRPDPGYREVWLIDRNVKAMSPMGYLNNGVGRFNIPDDLNLDQFPIVDVSAEPVNDADPTHSGDSILRGPAGVVTAGTFTKRSGINDPAFFAIEVAGLRWLAGAGPGSARVVRVVDVSPDHIVLERVTPTRPTRDAAEAFGRALAVTHAAGAEAFGAPPDGWSGDGYIGRQPLSMRSTATWGRFYAEQRVLPYARRAQEIGNLSRRGGALVERACERLVAGQFDDGRSPARIHGDLWSGNVIFTADGVVMIDPAAHGGHGLTDLAMLHLFGTPELSALTAAYVEAAGLDRDWESLIGLHQLHPLLVHAVSHGPSYGAAAEQTPAGYA